MTSYRIDSALPPSVSHGPGSVLLWSRKLKYLGIGLMLLSAMPYLVLATWVNLFSPELIAENPLFGISVDPVSSDIGGWGFIIGFPLGLALLLLGWILNGHIKDRKRFGRLRRLGCAALRLATSFGITIMAATFTPILQPLLTFVVGRN